MRNICVYCGSSNGRLDIYRDAGLNLGRAIADAGLGLVYGGGTRGIMGAVAKGAMERGGAVTGIIPKFLLGKEAPEAAAHGFDELIITENMHQRKHAMFERSDAFVTLPGGIGTLEEVVEMMTWAQLGHHEKPIVFANVDGFWQPMLTMLDHMRSEGFVHTGNRVQPIIVDDIAAIVPAILDTINGAAGDDAVIDRL